MRHAPPPAAPAPAPAASNPRTPTKAQTRREPSDEYDDVYPADDLAEAMQSKMELEDEVPDTTMLDSVVLPAIASVSTFDSAAT